MYIADIWTNSNGNQNMNNPQDIHNVIQGDFHLYEEAFAKALQSDNP